jgi:uncharacterized protein YjbI with pentapeptide repeats
MHARRPVESSMVPGALTRMHNDASLEGVKYVTPPGVAAMPDRPPTLGNGHDQEEEEASFVGAKLPDALLDGAKLDTSNWSNAFLDGAKLVGATGTGTIFAATSLRGASLDIARFTGATFDAACLDNAHFTRGRVCAGSARGTVLSGANLLDTVIPAESNTYTVDGNKFDCLAVSGQATTVTSSSTLCPDGASGPCTQAPRWVPLSAAPTCCNPWTDNVVFLIVGT